ncbi:MAG: hypothetical protein O3B73_06730 [bacterium]|nr:hypothetical protein [bacterium]
MSFFLQLSVCICLIILSGGSISFVLHDPSMVGGLFLLSLWAGFAFFLDRMGFGRSPRNENKMAEGDPGISTDRIKQLENRLADIQDIVIAIDEKLSRAEKSTQTSVRSGNEVSES